MSVIIRLQNLPWSANALDIRAFFRGLSIPDGGVHIIGGEMGDAFIAFSTDEDARQAMMNDRGKINEVQIRLLLSSRAEMQKVIEQARQQSLKMQIQIGATPAVVTPSASLAKPSVTAGTLPMPSPQPPVITSNSLQSILSNQLASVAAAAAAAVGNHSKPPSFQAYQQQAGIVVATPTKQASSSALLSNDSRKNRETSRDRRRSTSRERDRRRSSSQERNDSSRHRRDRSRSRSRERDHDSRKSYRSSRRSPSREDSRERIRTLATSKDGIPVNRSSQDLIPNTKSKESAAQSNLMLWNTSNAYQVNFTQGSSKATTTNLTTASSRNLLSQYGNTSASLPSIPILPNAYTTNINKTDTAAANKVIATATQAATPSVQNYTTSAAVTNLSSSLNLFSNLGGGDITKSMLSLQNPYTQALQQANSTRSSPLDSSTSSPLAKIATSQQQAAPMNVSDNVTKLNTTNSTVLPPSNPFGGTKTVNDDKETSAMSDFSAAVASANLAMGANPYASVYPGLFSAMNAATTYASPKQQQQHQQQQHHQQQQQQQQQQHQQQHQQNFSRHANSSQDFNKNNNNNSSHGNESFRDDQENGNSCIKVSNMCSSTCYSDIRKFFSGLYIPHNGIKMINDKHGLRVGVAYIRFVRPSNVQKALVRNSTMLKSKRVKLEAITDEEFDKHEDSYHPAKGRQSRFNQISPNRSCSPVSPSGDGDSSLSKFDTFAAIDSFKLRTYGQQKDNYNDRKKTDSNTLNAVASSVPTEPFSILYIEDIPSFAAEQDIIKMFSSYSIYDILLTPSPENRRECIAFVKFHRPEDAKAAYDDKSKHLIGNRQVRVTISTENEFNQSKEDIRLKSIDGNSSDDEDEDKNNSSKSSKRQKRDRRDGGKCEKTENRNYDNDDEDNDNDDDDDHDDDDDEERNDNDDDRAKDTDAMQQYNNPDHRIDRLMQQQQNNNQNQNYFSDKDRKDMIPSLFDLGEQEKFDSNSGSEKMNNSDPRLRRARRPSRFDAAPANSDLSNKNIFGNNNNNMNNSNNNNYNARDIGQSRHHNFQRQQQQQQQQDKELCFVLIKNCEYKTTIQDIGEYFMTKNLNAHHIEMLYNKRQQPCGDFIIEFSNQKDAQYAVMGFNNIRFNSRMMRVIRITPQEIADRLNMPFMNYYPRGNGSSYSGSSSNMRNNSSNNNNGMNRNNDFNVGPFGGSNNNFGINNNNNSNNFRGGGGGGGGHHDNNFNMRNMGRRRDHRNDMNNFRNNNDNDDDIDDNNSINLDDSNQNIGCSDFGSIDSHHGVGNGGGGGGEDHRKIIDDNGIPDKFNRPGCVLEMENVPYRAELMDIMNFFSGFNIKPDDIIRRFNDDGTATGDARVAFATEVEARAAYEAKRQKSILNRTIYLNML